VLTVEGRSARNRLGAYSPSRSTSTIRAYVEWMAQSTLTWASAVEQSFFSTTLG
jgi:hypothetical protein